MKLQGKTAIVAGASGGIGREISKALAKEGVEVVLVARNKKALTVLQGEIENKGGKAHVYTADLTDNKSVSRLADQFKGKFKQVDLVFHCIGVGVYKKLPEINLEDWESSFKVNVTSVFLLSQSFLPLLASSQKAHVIAFGSGMGKIGVAGRAPYCMSKFALRGLMQSLAKEYKKTNINFCLLTLGSVLTNFGPLTVKEKIEKQKKGKGYIDPEWLAGNIVVRLEHETLEDETSIYPPKYYEESKKGKT